MSDFVFLLSNFRVVSSLVPGAALCIFINDFLKVNILKDEVILNLFIFYTVGVVVGRVGSIIIEPLFESFGIIDKENYPDYIDAEIKNPKVSTIDEISRFYRSLTTLMMFIIVGIVIEYPMKMYPMTNVLVMHIVSVLMLILMIKSYSKQSKYTAKRIKKVLEEENENDNY